MKTVRWLLAALLVIAALSGCRLLLGEATLRVVNSSTEDIFTVYISPSYESNWGSDWLVGSIPADGGYRDFPDIIACDYDVWLRSTTYTITL